MTAEYLAELRAELRFITRDLQRLQSRKNELESILRSFGEGG